MPYCPRHDEEWDDVFGSCPSCFHTVNQARKANHPAILFIGAGLLSTAIAAITAGSALALTCPEDEEPITPSTGEPYCQPTTPITFPGAHEGDAGDISLNDNKDRGSGRIEHEKSDRDEFPDKRCGSGGEAPTCT